MQPPHHNRGTPVKSKAILFDQLYTHHAVGLVASNRPKIIDFGFTFPPMVLPYMQFQWPKHHLFHHLPGHSLPATWTSNDGFHFVVYYIKATANTFFDRFSTKRHNQITILAHCVATTTRFQLLSSYQTHYSAGSRT